MTDVFLDELVIADPHEIYLDELQSAEQFSVLITEQTDAADSSLLSNFIAATLDKLYIADSAIDTEQLQIFLNDIRATSAGVPMKGYYYNYYGSLQIAGNVPNLLLDLSNPMSHFLRSF